MRGKKLTLLGIQLMKGQGVKPQCSASVTTRWLCSPTEPGST